MVIEINQDNFKKEIEESKIPLIVDFFAPWCGPCHMMAPVFDKLSKEFNNRLKFVKMNTDENQEISEEYDIQGIPCLIIFDKGKEIKRIVGFRSETELRKEIEKVIKSKKLI